MKTHETNPVDTHLSSSSASGARAAPRSRARRWLLLGAIPVLAGALSLSAARAQMGGPDGGGMGMFAGHEGFMQQRLEHLLTAAGASDAQKAQIKKIWDGLRPQLKELHKQHAELRRQIGQAMAAATINTAAIEQLRQQSVQTMDKVSSLVTQGMIASAQVLTPAQRQTVLQQIEQHHRHHPGAGGGAGAAE